MGLVGGKLQRVTTHRILDTQMTCFGWGKYHNEPVDLVLQLVLLAEQSIYGCASVSQLCIR